MGCYLGPRASLDVVTKKKCPSPTRNSNPVVQSYPENIATKISLLSYSVNTVK
jgi:hypothetical protein